MFIGKYMHQKTIDALKHAPCRVTDVSFGRKSLSYFSEYSSSRSFNRSVKGHFNNKNQLQQQGKNSARELPLNRYRANVFVPIAVVNRVKILFSEAE
jgi:hypothetical protein